MALKKPQKRASKPRADATGESQFQALIETALDIVVVLNFDGTFRFLSPAVQRTTGYSPEELIGENAFAYMPLNDAAELQEVFSRVVSDPKSNTEGIPHSFRFQHKDGHWVLMETISTKLPEGPEPPGIVVNARDVTHRLQAHESLREAAESERRLAQEYEIIAEVGRIISSTLNIEEVFELFAAELSRLVEFEMVGASVVDSVNETTTLRYWSGPKEYRKNFSTTVPLEGSVTGRVVGSGKPVGVSPEDIQKTFVHLSDSQRGGILSWLGLPMVNRGETIGALLLFSSKADAFSDLDIALAGRVSDQIAGAIDNAGLFAGLKSAETELANSVIERSMAASQNEVIAEIGRIISSTLNIEEVFAQFGEQVRNLFDFSVLAICSLDVDRSCLRINHRIGDDVPGKVIDTKIPFEGSMAGEVAKTGSAIIVQGMTEQEIKESYPEAIAPYRSGIRSSLCMPLVNRGEFIGTLMAHSKKENAFVERDADMAQRVANQIAGAIDNAGLFAGLKSAETELANSVIERSMAASQNEVIAEIGRIISSTLNIEEVYESFTEQVRKLIGFDVLAICIVDREGRTGQIAHRVGDDRVGNRVGFWVPIDGSITGEVARLKQTIIVQGFSEQELQEKFPFTVASYRAEVRSWLCTPLVNGGEFVGSLLVLSKTENAFTDTDTELIQRVGNQIAGAIDSVRLYGELKAVETALTDSNVWNRMILETAHDAFIGMDDKGEVVAWNSQAETTFGWPAVEAMGRPVSDLIVPSRLVDQRLAGIKQFIDTENGPVLNQLVEMVAKHRDGHEFPAELTISPMKLGDRYFFYSFIRDITDRKESDDALSRSEERFRAVYNNAANGIGTRTLEGTPKDLNPAFLSMVGYTMEEVRALKPGVLYNIEYLDMEKRIFARALRGEDIPPYEKEYIHKDGTRIATEVRASLEVDDEGNAIGIVAVVTDITKRQLLEKEIAQYTESLEIANAEMQQLDQLKDEFISTVSHELRTPLTSIKGSAEILLTFDDEDRETRLEFLRIINKECDRLTRLVTEVLDLSRMESREMNWNWGEVNLEEVVAAAVDGTQSLLLQKGLAITVKVEPEMPHIWNDRDRLVQVVTNLLSNSIKFTPAGGEIHVKAGRTTSKDGEEMQELCVSDTGIGIETADHLSIFQKFKQVAETLSDKPTGTGLGLPICKEIVEYSGGNMWVESELGKGSAFYFTVPLSSRGEQPVEQSEF